MNTLTITSRYLALYVGNSGLTMLLPSAGHDATLVAGSTSIALRGASVWLERDGAPMRSSKPASARSNTGLMHIDRDILTFVDLDRTVGGSKVRADVLSRPIEQLPELNARVTLPAGVLQGATLRGAPSRYAFRRKGGSALPLGGDSVTYDIALPDGPRYTLVIQTGVQRVDIDVTQGGAITIANADRPSRDTSTPDWIEIRHLYDLLDWPNLEYPYPSAAKGKSVMTPWVDPCMGILAGEFRWTA